MTRGKIEGKHISFSQVNMFTRCGEQYRRRYIEGEIIAPSGAMVRGRSCHKAEEMNFLHKIHSSEFLAVADVVDVFSDTWEEERYSIVWNADDLEGDSPKTAAGKMKDSGVRMLKVFHVEQLVNCQPVELEVQCSVKFEGIEPVLVGYIDRIDEGDIIAEQKFVKKSPTKTDILTDTQLTNYDFLFGEKYERPPKGLKKQWAVDLATPKTVIQTAPPRTHEEKYRYLNRIETFLDALKKGVFIPASTSDWVCSEKWCGYWSTCKYRA